MRAILVSVDYGDILALTLPRSRGHFKELMIVSDLRSGDKKTATLAGEYGCHLHLTDIFYEGGASFNKWAALEQGLDHFGRDGWICLLDADIVFPLKIPDFPLEAGCLYSPLRRMQTDVTRVIPPDSDWEMLPIHRNTAEWAGYCQIFHGSDPVLGKPPWHETNWKHAGGADSFFQQKWPQDRKIRPPFEVLHLGPAGENWFGRASRYTDGNYPVGSSERLERMRSLWRERKQQPRGHEFDKEKL